MSGRPVRHCTASQFGSVVTSQHRRVGAALAGEVVQFGDQVLAGDAAVDQTAETLTGVLIDDQTQGRGAATRGGVDGF